VTKREVFLTLAPSFRIEGESSPFAVVEQELLVGGDVSRGDEDDPWAVADGENFWLQVEDLAGVVDQATEPPVFF